MNNRTRIPVLLAALAVVLALVLPGTAAGAADYVPFVTDFPEPAEQYVPFVSDFPEPAAPAADPVPASTSIAWDAVAPVGVATTIAAALALVLLGATRRRHESPTAAGC